MNIKGKYGIPNFILVKGGSTESPNPPLNLPLCEQYRFNSANRSQYRIRTFSVYYTVSQKAKTLYPTALIIILHPDNNWLI